MGIGHIGFEWRVRPIGIGQIGLGIAKAGYGDSAGRLLRMGSRPIGIGQIGLRIAMAAVGGRHGGFRMASRASRGRASMPENISVIEWLGAGAAG
jgi:hypothetical protein